MKIQLTYKQCAGDTLVSTAAVASLKLTSPQYKIRVSGGHSEAIFENSPHIEWFTDNPDMNIVMDNKLINENHIPWHFMKTYCDTLAAALGHEVPLSVSRPELWLNDDEQKWVPRITEIIGKKMPYWLVCRPGAKDDYTVKRYSNIQLQEVINKLRHKILFVQTGEKNHKHIPLDGCIDEIGKTNLRQLIRMAYHAEGILTGESFLWHVAAAFNKPAVCLASGWLAKQWISYPGQTLLSKHGTLPCCTRHACDALRVVSLNDGDKKNNNLCHLPVFSFETPVPKCMAMITPDEVVNAIESYYIGGRLKW